MRDYVDDYLRSPDKPMSNSTRVVLKCFVLGFVSVAVEDLLRSNISVGARIVGLSSLLSGIVAQQIVPPRFSVGKLVLFGAAACAVEGLIFLGDLAIRNVNHHW